jgi:hypothetical protein
MIEEVVDPILDVRDIEHPAFVRNLNPELMFLIALRGDRSECVFAPGKLLA